MLNIQVIFLYYNLCEITTATAYSLSCVIDTKKEYFLDIFLVSLTTGRLLELELEIS